MLKIIELNELIDKLKDSVNNPTIMISSYDGSDEEEFDNDVLIDPILEEKEVE